MIVLIYADTENAELLMKELLTVMRSFYSVLDLDNRLVLKFVFVVVF